jgi:hypothetical protein
LSERKRRDVDRRHRRPRLQRMSAVVQSWRVLGIGMATIFGVILVFYAMIRLMLRMWREG